ncbi:hypothetical protein ABPG72_020836 [Tetrahymena utriculariae]
MDLVQFLQVKESNQNFFNFLRFKATSCDSFGQYSAVLFGERLRFKRRLKQREDRPYLLIGRGQLQLIKSSCEVDETLIAHLNEGTNRVISQALVLGAHQRDPEKIIVKSISFLESLYIEIQEQGYILAALYALMVWKVLGMKEYVNHSHSFGLGQDKTNRIQSIWSETKYLGSFYSSLNFFYLNDLQSVQKNWKLDTQNSSQYIYHIELNRALFMHQNSYLGQKI